MEIIPAVIPDSIDALKDTLETISTFTKRVQVDVVDGKFVPFISWPYNGAGADFDAFKTTLQDFDADLDLMAHGDPGHVTKWVASGISRIVLHIEACSDLEESIRAARESGAAVGLSILNSTPLQMLTDRIDLVDFVQVMGIADIGTQGQSFDERSIERVVTLRDKYPELEIVIDGSVNKDTLPRLRDAGATNFVVGSAILSAEDPKAVYEELVSLL